MQTLESYVCGAWRRGDGAPVALVNPATDETIAEIRGGGFDGGAVLECARTRGGPALREMGFRRRAGLLKRLADALHARRDELLEISIRNAGTTRGDAKFDVDGAIGTLAAYAGFGEALPDKDRLTDGDVVQLGRTPRFSGRHILTPRLGVALHINAFNFPAWNMMEKAACALLAGVPVIEKPGTPTAMLAWRIARVVEESGVLPAGAWQFIVGPLGDLVERLGPQDGVAFTGSSRTAATLRGSAAAVSRNVRMNLEADSLNAAILAPDVEPGSDTWALFLSMTALEITQKTGQKCTAVRRIFVPAPRVDEVAAELVERLNAVVIGDPAASETRMGPLASPAQLRDVRGGIDRLAGSAATLCGGSAPIRDRGCFVAPTLLRAKDARTAVFHEDEVFGPVATILPYDGAAGEAAELAALGGGGLVCAAYSNDAAWTERAVLGLAPWHGRVWIGSDKMAEQALSPGMVLPAMIHGGPGRAGGGEELGGLRGLAFYLQRTALQGYRTRLEESFG